MFEERRHRLIASILEQLNAQLLADAECYFAGGTAISLLLNEYRESLDIDFLCASAKGYGLLRQSVHQYGTLGDLLDGPMDYRRDVRADRYGIRAVLEVEGVPIKVEFVREDRVTLEGDVNDTFAIPTLSKNSFFTQKILANVDRGFDRTFMSRDLIDLAMMVRAWGHVPSESWQDAFSAYGADDVVRVFDRTKQMIDEDDYLSLCLTSLGMDRQYLPIIQNTVGEVIYSMPRSLEREDGLSP